MSRSTPIGFALPHKLRSAIRTLTRPRMYSEHVHRGYKEAVKALNSLQSNANVLAAIQAAGPLPAHQVVGQTTHYLRRLGYKPEALNALNVIHISGTKGKGSTAAFCCSLLTTINPESKIGLFTSPHLVAVRERIRINGKPISEDLFAKYFWEVWDRFGNGYGEPEVPELSSRPAYFRYLTFMAYHVFLSERVDASILEVGVGGLVDPTNLVPSPIVTGVTSLGLDHVQILGNSISEIAGHKGGIFKPGVPALTIKQDSLEALGVLRARAIELKASSFSIVPSHPELDQTKLGLAGDHQKTNASLALALINAFLSSPRLPTPFTKFSTLTDKTASKIPSSTLPPLPTNLNSSSNSSSLPGLDPEIITPRPISDIHLKALRNARWDGRCQVIQRDKITWYLDGAHTIESISCCANWYREFSLKKTVESHMTFKKVLIFNCTSGRSANDLLNSLVNCLVLDDDPESLRSLFDLVIVCTNTTFESGQSKGDLTCVATQLENDKKSSGLTLQNQIATSWKHITGLKNVIVTRSIEEAVSKVYQINIDDDENKIMTNVLVTGSLHLVGGVLEVAQLLDS